MSLALSARPGDHGTVVRVEGEIDVCVEAPLQEVLLQIIRGHSPALLVDLSGVFFMDCAGLRALVLTRRRAELRGGSMCVLAVSEAVRKIIILTGMGADFLVPRHRESGNGVVSGPPVAEESYLIDPRNSTEVISVKFM